MSATLAHMSDSLAVLAHLDQWKRGSWARNPQRSRRGQTLREGRKAKGEGRMGHYTLHDRPRPLEGYRLQDKLDCADVHYIIYIRCLDDPPGLMSTDFHRFCFSCCQVAAMFWLGFLTHVKPIKTSRHGRDPRGPLRNCGYIALCNALVHSDRWNMRLHFSLAFSAWTVFFSSM